MLLLCKAVVGNTCRRTDRGPDPDRGVDQLDDKDIVLHIFNAGFTATIHTRSFVFRFSRPKVETLRNFIGSNYFYFKSLYFFFYKLRF